MQPNYTEFYLILTSLISSSEVIEGYRRLEKMPKICCCCWRDKKDMYFNLNHKCKETWRRRKTCEELSNLRQIIFQMKVYCMQKNQFCSNSVLTHPRINCSDLWGRDIYKKVATPNQTLFVNFFGRYLRPINLDRFIFCCV